MIDKKILSTAQKLAKTNRYWQSFLAEIKAVNREIRVMSLLTFLMMEYYINEILIMNGQLKNHQERMPFDKKLEKLKRLKIMPVSWINDIKKFEEIRNAYAHTIEVRDKFIDGKLNSFKTTNSITVPKTRKLKLYAVAQLFTVRLQRKYNEVLIRT